MCRLRNILKGMKTRCYNKNRPEYKNYGARGITVCDEWCNDLNKFRSWANNNGYADDLTIDRINNDGNYEPSNCRWVTKSENNKNKSTNRNFIIDGTKMNLKDISRKYRVNYDSLIDRVNKGVSIEEAVKNDYKKINFSTLLNKYTKLINTARGNLKVTGVQVNETTIRLEATCSCGAIKYYKKTTFLASKSCGSTECIKKLFEENRANGSYTRDENNQRFVKK